MSERRIVRGIVSGLVGTLILGGFLVLLIENSSSEPQLPLQLPDKEPSAVSALDHSPAQDRELVNEPGCTPETGAYSCPTGSELEFECSARANTELSAKEGHTVRVAHKVSGQLKILIADRRQNEIVLLVSVCDARVGIDTGNPEADRQSSDSLEQGLRIAYTARIRDDGAILGYRFPEAIPQKARDWQRSLLLTMLHRIPEGEQLSWTCAEKDRTGTASVRYKWLGGPIPEGHRRLHREKLRYSSGPEGAVDQPLPDVKASSVATFDGNVGWVRELRSREEMRLAIPGSGMVVQLEMSAEMVLGKTRRIPCSELPTVEWEGDWGPVQGLLAASDQPSAEEEAHFRGVLEDVTLADLVLEIGQLNASGQFGSHEMFLAKQKLTWMLRLDPELLKELGAILRQSAVHPDAAGAILAAAGMAQHGQAQEFLSELLADGSVPLHLRFGAALSAFQVSKPGERIIQTVRTLARNGTGVLRDTNMLLMGAIASRLGAGDQNHVLRDLLGLEARSKQPGALATWLRAVANAGVKGSLPAVEKYLAHEDSNVRTAAIEALSSSEMPGVVRRIIKSATSDSSWRVRSSAVEALAPRCTSETLDTLIRIARTDGDAQVRTTALQVLAKHHGKRSKVQALLRHLAGEDSSANIRALARSLIAG